MQLTAFIALSAVWLSSSDGLAQQPVSFSPKRVLVLFWDEKDYPANVEFESQFQAALRSAASRPIELYSEFLESNRFPGENQSEFLRDYIKQKYAGRTVDVVVPTAAAPLDFLFKYHSDLFPQVPVVFSSAAYPSAAQLRSGAGATGIVIANTYRKTLDLALRLHPDTQQVFVVSGSMARDRFYEKAARSQLDGYESKAAITYLTDLSLEELKVRLSNLPERSIVLYVWDWARNTEGKFLESREILNLIAPSARVPLYGMSFANVGHGIVGGYVWTMETTTARLAQMTLKVAYGARASDILVESAPEIPMFDWRQVQRWRIPEDRLPEGSVIRFRELTLWQQYKWRIIATITIIVLQSLLIGALLLQRRRARQNASALGKAQRVLRESEERFRNMANTAPVNIVVKDANRQATFFNKRWLDFTGRTMEQELGQGWIAGVHPDDLDECMAELWASLEAHVDFELEYRLRRADGKYRSVTCRGVPRFEQDGTFVGYVESVLDITELKQALSNQKLESLGVLAGGIAHDFNNLLGGILAEAELVETDLTAGSAPSEGIQRIKTAAIRGSEIVRELMIYAGEEQKDLNETVDVSRLVEEMLKLLKVSISKQVVLRTDCRKDVPAVRGNAPQIRQVVMNLVLNASEAIGDAKGVITVTTAQVSGGRDLAPNNATDLTPDDYVRLEVSDTGSGMTEQTKGKIFDPFFSTKFPGRGLGLAVVQGIVRELGGGINIVSAPGQGTAFQVLLPCAPKKASEIHSAIIFGGLEKSNARAGTILVVEDEEMLRRAVSQALLKRGFLVIDASDGSVAMDMIHAHKNDIDIVLLDVTLPGASSREVFEEALRMRPDLKVIVTSAYGEEMVDSYFSGMRVDHFIRKPFHLDDLVRLFETALSAKANSARTP